jgi:hypothetical protein
LLYILNIKIFSHTLLDTEKHLTIENCLEFLSTRLTPLDQIERYWKHISYIRLNRLKLGMLSLDDTFNSDISTATSQERQGEKKKVENNLKVCNYFAVYKSLKQPLGYTLVCIYYQYINLY